jgi:hypothetical protein
VLTKGEDAFKDDSDDEDDFGLTGARKKAVVSAQKLGFERIGLIDAACWSSFLGPFLLCWNDRARLIFRLDA